MSASLRFAPPACAGLAAAGLALAWAGGARAAQIQCWYENGAVVAPAAFGDMAGDFIIDASAPKSLLLEDRANADGIDAPTAVRDLRLAGERISGFEMPLTNLNERAVRFPTTINGVVGWDVLGRYRVTIAFSPCRLTLQASSGRPGGRRRPPRGRLALKTVDGAAAVAATASDGTRLRSGWYAVDTASMGTRFSPADTSFSPPLRRKVDPTWRFQLPARIRALEVGGELFEATPAGLLPKPPTDLAGAIGLAVWSRYRITLDGPGGWMTLAR
ncbi:hypothetical protein ACO2Q3_13220 [Caulobacter sp. KR2-114]|uniref:hypothetical protein n=1 Tax=Caulobacter sp. KR2-114 TaxID=3400912 RepID=UPI003C0C395E